MKRLLATFLGLWLSIASFSQVDVSQIPLDTFRLPDIDRRALEFSGNFIGSYRSINSAFVNALDEAHEVRPQFDLAYSRYVNRPDLQRQLNYSLSHSFRSSRNKEGFETGSQLSYGGQNRVSLDQRKYKGNQFLLSGGDALLGLSISKNKSLDTNLQVIRREHDIDARVSLLIGFGTGRIEPVYDLAIALFVLQDVQLAGVDMSSLSATDAYGFASLMAQVRNRRILDSRRKRIQDLRDLYQYMDEKGWVLRDDPAVFALLVDNWISTPLGSRFTGKRWTFFAQPIAWYEKGRTYFGSGNPNDFSETSMGGVVGMEFISYRPVSLHVQTERSHELSLGYTQRGDDPLFANTPGEYWQFTTEHAIGKSWYPNNRASISGRLNLRYVYYRFLENSIFLTEDDQHVVRPTFSLGGSYFISWKTRLIVDSTIGYGYNSGGALASVSQTYATSYEANAFEASLSARLLVSIF